jgi:hypothetical protein
VVTAVYLLNHLPTQSLDGKTPYEVWHGKKPSVHDLRTFGCVAYIKETNPYLAKLYAHGKRVVFIGYEAGSKAYRVSDPMQNKVHVSHDIVFIENMFWQWDADGSKKLHTPSQWSIWSGSQNTQQQMHILMVGLQHHWRSQGHHPLLHHVALLRCFLQRHP